MSLALMDMAEPFDRYERVCREPETYADRQAQLEVRIVDAVSAGIHKPRDIAKACGRSYGQRFSRALTDLNQDGVLTPFGSGASRRYYIAGNEPKAKVPHDVLTRYPTASEGLRRFLIDWSKTKKSASAAAREIGVGKGFIYEMKRQPMDMAFSYRTINVLAKKFPFIEQLRPKLEAEFKARLDRRTA